MSSKRDGPEYSEEDINEEKFRPRAEEVITDDVPMKESLTPFPVQLIKVSTVKEIQFGEPFRNADEDPLRCEEPLPETNERYDTENVDYASSNMKAEVPEIKEELETKESWQDIKSSTKSKAATLAREASRTGGGPQAEPDLSEFQKRVLRLPRHAAVFGHHQTQESIVILDFEEGSSNRAKTGHEIQNITPTFFIPTPSTSYLSRTSTSNSNPSTSSSTYLATPSTSYRDSSSTFNPPFPESGDEQPTTVRRYAPAHSLSAAKRPKLQNLYVTEECAKTFNNIQERKVLLKEKELKLKEEELELRKLEIHQNETILRNFSAEYLRLKELEVAAKSEIAAQLGQFK